MERKNLPSKMAGSDDVAFSLHDVFQICIENGVFRLVKINDDEMFYRITVCGVFRIQKNKLNGAVTQWAYHLKTASTGEWRRRKSLPVPIWLFWRKNITYSMNEWLTAAISQVIDSLVKSGFSMRIKTTLFRVRERNQKTKLISSMFPQEVISLYYHDDLCQQLGEKDFSYPHDYPKSVGYTSRTQFYDNMVKKIRIRSWGFVSESVRDAAAKLLCKHIWEMVDKSIFSQYAKSDWCSIIRQSLTNATFSGYLVFSKRILIENDTDFKGLWPMVGLLHRQQGKHTFRLSGKTRELFEQLSFPDEITYGDFKKLRHVSPTLVAMLKEIPRADTQKKEKQLKTVIKLLRNPHIKCYPVKVIFWVMEYLAAHFRTEQAAEIYRVCEKWLEYYTDLYRNIGFKEQEGRWRTEVNHLEHVIDWIYRTESSIHKNQSWPSFWRLAEEWTQGLRRDDALYGDYHDGSFCDDDVDKASWTGVNVDLSTINPGVKEITTVDDLYKEGDEMCHCVASYRRDCAYGNYRVFSIICDDERATLGVSREHHKSTYMFDQIRGTENSSVSRRMENLGKKILSLVNASIN